MTDIEKAIKEIKHQVFMNTDNCEMTISKECYKAIIESMEKQIPKRAEWGKTAKVRNRNTVTWVCPVCRYHVTSEYCRKCGQAITWKDARLEQKGK